MKRLLPSACLLATLACVSAPEIVVTDRATALEQQASGSFDQLERKLTRTGIVPRPVPLTPEELQALGIQTTLIEGEHGSTDADRMDGLLQRHCIGEGREGLLVDTYKDCKGASDRATRVALVDRVNRARVQLWRWMGTERKDLSADEIRRTWQVIHLKWVVCGAWLQRADGAWEEKKC